MEEETTPHGLPSISIDSTSISEEESFSLFKRFEGRLVAYVYGIERPHCDGDEGQLDSNDKESLDAFWEDARERLLQRHLDMLQIRCARMLRDLGGDDLVDAVIDDMGRALAEGRRTLGV